MVLKVHGTDHRRPIICNAPSLFEQQFLCLVTQSLYVCPRLCHRFAFEFVLNHSSSINPVSNYIVNICRKDIKY